MPRGPMRPTRPGTPDISPAGPDGQNTDKTQDDAGSVPPTELARLKSELEKGLSIVQEHIRSLEDKQQQQQSMQRLQQIVIGTAGLNAMVSSIQRSYSPEKPPTANVQAEFSGLQGRVMGLNESRAMIESQPLTVSSDTAALGMVERTMGMIGSLDWIHQQLDALKRGETVASFDSELSLILWSDYQTYRWQPNYLNYRFEGSPLRQLYPTLMVSRLEAPTLALTKGLMVVLPMIEESWWLDGQGLPRRPRHCQKSPMNRSKAAATLTLTWLCCRRR